MSERVFKLPPEQQAILDKCFHPSGTFVEFKKEEIEQSIPERFEKIVRIYPDRIAVKTSNQTLTYAELNVAANRLARAIVARQGEKAEPVGLLLEKAAPLMAAMLGVLKAGKFFVLLDPAFPKARIAAVLEDSQARLVVTDRPNASLAREVLNHSGLIEVESIDSRIPNEDLRLQISPKALAYLIYTSGSTGKPKGVMQNHRNILHDAMPRTNAYRISKSDRLSLLASGTATATGNIFLALLNGATLCSFDVQKEGPASLAVWLLREGISFCRISSPLFRKLCEVLTGKESFPDLRLIQLASATIYKSDVALYRKHFSKNCILATGLSSSEAGFHRDYLIDDKTEISGNEVPVGYAVDGKEVLLLDDTGKEIGFNQVGEIAVRGYVSPGYWRNPALTRAHFKLNPNLAEDPLYHSGDLGLMLSDGCLIHKGRNDFRVKIRGYGVDMTEVEKILCDHAAIREAVVMARADELGEARLVAYFTSLSQRSPTVSELRGFLRNKLPDYMIPSAFVMLDGMPLSSAGKVDRSALPAPGKSRPELDTRFTLPRTSAEETLAKIWAEVLGFDQIGIHDNFFDLGGHSLLAAEMMRRVERACGERLPLTVLFTAPTIEGLAQALRKQRVEEDQSLLVKIQPGGAKPPFFFLHGDLMGGGFYCSNLARRLGEDRPFYALVPQGLNGSSVPDTVEEMAALYLQMVRAVQPEGPYLLGGWCNGGTVAFEMAQQLRQQGQQVSLVALVGASPRNDPAKRLARGLAYGVGSLLGLGPKARLRLFFGLRICGRFIRRFYPSRRFRRTRRDNDLNDLRHRCFSSYITKPYSGRVSLFWPSEQSFGSSKDPTFGWSRVVPQIEVQEVPGDHISCVKRHVAVLADRMKTCIEKAQRESV